MVRFIEIDDGTDPRRTAMGYHLLGRLAARSNPSEAINLLQRSLDLLRGHSDVVVLGRLLRDLARAYVLTAQTDRAISGMTEALALFEASGDRREYVQCLIERGNIPFVGVDYELAASYYLRAHQISLEIGCATGEACALSNLGSAYSELGRPRMAMDCWHRAAQLFAELRAPYSEQLLRYNLALLQGQTGQLREAIENTAQLVDYFRHTGHRVMVARSTCQLGILYYCGGNLEKAEQIWRRSLSAYAQATGHIWRADPRPYLAAVYAEQGLLDLATATFEAAHAPRSDVERVERDLTRAILSIGQAHVALNAGARDEALQHLEMARRWHSLDPTLPWEARLPKEMLESIVTRRSVLRLAHSVLAASLGRLESRLSRSPAPVDPETAPSVLQLDPQGRGFWPPGGHVVDLRSRRAHSGVLALLVKELGERPDRAVSVEELFKAGWEGESAVAQS